MRTLAAQNALPLASAVDRIVLGRKYDLESWFLEAFITVCTDPRPLALQPGANGLGVDDLLRISHAREKIQSMDARQDPSAIRNIVISLCLDYDSVPINKDDVEDKSSPSSTVSSFDTLNRAEDEDDEPQPQAAAHILGGTDVPHNGTLVKFTDDLLSWKCGRRAEWELPHNSPMTPEEIRSLWPQAHFSSIVNSLPKDIAKLRAIFHLLITYGIQDLVSQGVDRDGTYPLDLDDLYSHPPTFMHIICALICTDTSASFSSQVAGKLLSGEALARHIVGEQCLGIFTSANKSLSAKTHREIEDHHRGSLIFLIFLRWEELLSDAVMTQCVSDILSLPDTPMVPDVRRVVALLNDVGKYLDVNPTTKVLNRVFAHLRRLRIEPAFHSVETDIEVCPLAKCKLRVRRG